MLRSILIVEDNPNDVELTIEGLKECNLANEFHVAKDGAEALEYLRYQGRYADREKGNPAVVLLDLKLPKKTGHEVLEELKADPDLKAIPVVILTSSNQESDLARSYHNGANAYLVKPVDFENFTEAIKHLGIFWGVLNEPPPGSKRRL